MLGGACWPAGWSFTQPYDAFWTLASILGLLLIFQSGLDIITSVDARGINSAWWLGMVAGILENLLGFWASPAVLVGTQGRCCWSGSGSSPLFRGISEIVIAFEVRSRQTGLAASRACTESGTASCPPAQRGNRIKKPGPAGLQPFPLALVAWLAWMGSHPHPGRGGEEDARGGAGYHLACPALDAGTRCFEDTLRVPGPVSI